MNKLIRSLPLLTRAKLWGWRFFRVLMGQPAVIMVNPSYLSEYGARVAVMYYYYVNGDVPDLNAWWRMIEDAALRGWRLAWVHGAYRTYSWNSGFFGSRPDPMPMDFVDVDGNLVDLPAFSLEPWSGKIVAPYMGDAPPKQGGRKFGFGKYWEDGDGNVVTEEHYRPAPLTPLLNQCKGQPCVSRRWEGEKAVPARPKCDACDGTGFKAEQDVIARQRAEGGYRLNGTSYNAEGKGYEVKTHGFPCTLCKGSGTQP